MNINLLHSGAWDRLQARRKNLPHALLLIGHRGIGKFELVRAFVAGLLCEQPDITGLACGQCQACHWENQGSHPDLRWLVPEALRPGLLPNKTEDEEEGAADAEKNDKKASQEIKIEQIRALDSFLSVGTHRQGLRIVVIYPAETMNRNTANAILKSLEEPPAGTLFVLISSDHHRLLPTIRSRCQIEHINTPSIEGGIAYLKSVLPTQAHPARWLALAGGAPFAARDLAADGHRHWQFSLFDGLAQGGQISPIDMAATLDKQFKDEKVLAPLSQTVDWCMKWLLDLTLTYQALPARYFIDQASVMSQLKNQVNDVSLIRFYRQRLLPMRREAAQPLNAKLFLEALFSDYKALFSDFSHSK